MSEVKPEAFLNKYGDGTITVTKDPDFPTLLNHLVSSKPLYTKEQLQTRVKMSQAQQERLMWDKKNTDLSTCLGYFLEHDGNDRFGVSTENLLGNLTQEDIARAWLKPEETIEIVPDKKWFVRSKERVRGLYMFLSNLETLKDSYFFTKEDSFTSFAHKFDTKEQAEEWTNPLTEAVLLPIDD